MDLQDKSAKFVCYAWEDGDQVSCLADSEGTMLLFKGGVASEKDGVTVVLSCEGQILSPYEVYSNNLGPSGDDMRKLAGFLLDLEASVGGAYRSRGSGWIQMGRIEILGEEIRGRWVLPTAEEMELYQLLGDVPPFWWPFEQLYDWARDLEND